MTVVINLTSASSDLKDYLQNDWATDFLYSGNGEFNPPFGPPGQTFTQWSAGDATDPSQSGVILDSPGFTYSPPGDFTGPLTSLTFGSDLDDSSGFSLGTSELTMDLTGASATTAFTQAIYVLSHFGSFVDTAIPEFGGVVFDGLYSYFAQEGTVQNGTVGNDSLYSFGGDDVLTGNGGDDTFVFEDGFANDTVTDFDSSDLLDLSDVANISSVFDLFTHTNWSDNSNVLTFTDGTDTIELTGYVGSDVFGLYFGGNLLLA